MPRYSRIPAILRTKTRGNPDVIKSNTPRLWNAKRRIKQSHGLTPGQYAVYKRDAYSEDWRKQVSTDVVSFIDVNTSDRAEDIALRDHKLLPEEKRAIIRQPSQFFSRPQNVPPLQRKQVYFPNFRIALIRTPYKSPYYATFDVPLWFNKLDIKSYLKELYDVDIVHVRSYIKQPATARKDESNPRRRGKLFRPPSTKRMNVQLVDAFEWPKEITDFADFDKEEYWRAAKAQMDLMSQESERMQLIMKPDQEHRKTIAEQARDLLSGKTIWQPTWTQLDSDKQVMEGIADVLPKPPKVVKKGRSRLGREVLEGSSTTRELPRLEDLRL